MRAFALRIVKIISPAVHHPGRRSSIMLPSCYRRGHWGSRTVWGKLVFYKVVTLRKTSSSNVLAVARENRGCTFPAGCSPMRRNAPTTWNLALGWGVVAHIGGTNTRRCLCRFSIFPEGHYLRGKGTSMCGVFVLS